MRKATISFILAFMALGLNAQSMYDALDFSKYNYGGTARSIAMGNAFTALGGDIGGTVINPAGSAVARYSQFTITPGLSISVNNAGGTILQGDSAPYSFGKDIRNSMTKFHMPNIGLSLNLDMHRKNGLKNINIGFIVNTTNLAQDALSARGENQNTSFMAALAASTNGIPVSELTMENAYNQSNAPWMSILGYRSGMIGDINGETGEYVGSSEKIMDDGKIMLGGPLDQTFQRMYTGNRHEYTFNAAFNISDLVYIGANLVVTSMIRNQTERFTESAIDPNDFDLVFNNNGVEETTFFDRMEYRYDYAASGAGVHGKLGVIVTPGSGLRFGAAIQTPGTLGITETWEQSASTSYLDSRYDAKDETPRGEYSYRLITPVRFNAGIAWTFGNLGVISADYEICDYSMMRLKETGIGTGEFDFQNQDIKEFMGSSHMMRAGLEIKPLPYMAVRAGYGLTSSPEKFLDGNSYIKDKSLIHNGSIGLGFSTNGTFFCDLVCAFTQYSKEYVYPYNDYIFNGDVLEFPSPEILNRKMLWNAAVTLGFRF